jgi:hypothetical protein
VKAILLLVMLAILPFGQPSRSEVCTAWEDQHAAMENMVKELRGGYCDHLGRYVPKLVTTDSYLTFRQPILTIGSITWYARGVMESVVGGNLPPGYIDGIALMACSQAHEGSTVYLDAGSGWIGPFVAVDCPAQQHMYSNIVFDGDVAEVGFVTAQMLGMVSLNEAGEPIVNQYSLSSVKVCISANPGGDCAGNPVEFSSWWLENATFYLPRESPASFTGDVM